MTNSGNVFCVLLIEEGVEMKSIRRERERREGFRHIMITEIDLSSEIHFFLNESYLYKELACITSTVSNS